jgi:hypothetical protein
MANFKQVKLSFTAELMVDMDKEMDLEELKEELCDALSTFNDTNFLVADEQLFIKGL